MKAGDVQAVIARTLHKVACEVPYAIEIDESTARLVDRVFAELSEDRRAVAELEVREWLPAWMVFELKCESSPYDLRALAENAMFEEPGAAEVFVDALLELGIINPAVHGNRWSDERSLTFRAYLRRGLAWAFRVFPSLTRTRGSFSEWAAALERRPLSGWRA